MKIKYIILAILFCFVSASAFAWSSWPWAKKEIPPRVIAIPPSETTPPGESTPITKYWCKETPEIVRHLVAEDAYCCNDEFYSDAYGVGGRELTEENIEICLGQKLARLRGAGIDLINIYGELCPRESLHHSGWIVLGRGDSIDQRIQNIVTMIDNAISQYDDLYGKFVSKIKTSEWCE